MQLNNRELMEIKTVAAAELWSTSLTPVRDLHVLQNFNRRQILEKKDL